MLFYRLSLVHTEACIHVGDIGGRETEVSPTSMSHYLLGSTLSQASTPLWQAIHGMAPSSGLWRVTQKNRPSSIFCVGTSCFTGAVAFRDVFGAVLHQTVALITSSTHPVTWRYNFNGDTTSSRVGSDIDQRVASGCQIERKRPHYDLATSRGRSYRSAIPIRPIMTQRVCPHPRAQGLGVRRGVFDAGSESPMPVATGVKIMTSGRSELYHTKFRSSPPMIYFATI